jgi:hypothetical protein
MRKLDRSRDIVPHGVAPLLCKLIDQLPRQPPDPAGAAAERGFAPLPCRDHIRLASEQCVGDAKSGKVASIHSAFSNQGGSTPQLCWSSMSGSAQRAVELIL